MNASDADLSRLVERSLSGTIGFAHRGAALTSRGHNTLPAFERALALGADGLETDVSLTADGVPVLVHPRLLPARGPAMSTLMRRDLPEHIPSLADLYDRCGTDFALSLDMRAPQAAAAVISEAAEHDALARLHLTYWKLSTLEAWRVRWPEVQLMFATMPLRPRQTVRLMARLSDIDVGLNMHHWFCSRSLIELALEKQLRIFAWGVRKSVRVESLVARGVDGVYCDDVEGMVRVLNGRRNPTCG
ncbi:MAG: glycerophosphodiester phosphodiesterase [Chloroflexota bacterium]